MRRVYLNLISLRYGWSRAYCARLRHEHKQDRPEVIRYQIRVVREDGLRSFPLSKQTENEFDGGAHALGIWPQDVAIVCGCYRWLLCEPVDLFN
jgi:hypothetical protein